MLTYVRWHARGGQGLTIRSVELALTRMGMCKDGLIRRADDEEYEKIEGMARHYLSKFSGTIAKVKCVVR